MSFRKKKKEKEKTLIEKVKPGEEDRFGESGN